MRYRPREKEKKSKKLVINLTPQDHQFLKVLAADQRIPMSHLVIQSLSYYLREVMREDREIQKH